MAARFCKDPGGCKGFVAQFKFGSMAKRRADGQRIPLSGKLLRHKVAFRAVFQCKLYPKLLCDADCGEQVVRLMRMRLERHFAFKHGQKRLKFYVERNILSRILLLFVIPRTQEHFAYFCGGGHAGRDALFPVTPLWIFPQKRISSPRRRARPYRLPGCRWS